MKTAVVHRNLTDLNVEPHFLAERKTQALFGETLSILDTLDDYALVRQSDGYEGWARSAALTDIDSVPSQPAWFVTDPVAAVYDESGEQVAPYFLTYGAQLRPSETGEAGDELTEVRAPSGRSLWIDSAAIDRPLAAGALDRDNLAESILNGCREFLGVPYLWGGRSSLGLDCSALVQLVFAFHGITLPRDSGDQREVGEEVARKNLRPADLIFSPGHVVVYIGDSEFIHASLGEGGVAYNSYDPGATNYRADLDRDYQIARRLF